MDKTYSDYAASKTVELLGIDSPTGFTAKAAEWVKAQFEALGYTASITEKGGVLIELDGENAPTRCCSRLTPTRSVEWWPRSRATAASA